MFEPARPFLEACLLGQSAPGRRRNARLWPFIAAAAVIPLALGGWRWNSQARWNRYFDALKRQHGIVVTGIERSGPFWAASGWVVSGLKDPQAPDPADLLRAQHLDPRKVQYAWQPFLSLNTPFAVQRDLGTAVNRIRNQIVRFDTDKSTVVMAEADRIDELTVAIGDLLRLRPNATIRLIGHADEVGNPALNDKLSLDRAIQVADALVAQGVPRSALVPVGSGNTKPPRAGRTDWDRATNRSVSFEVTLQ